MGGGALRAAGDERTLSQLRFDIAALPLHGTLDLPQVDLDQLDEILTPERLAELIAVAHARPKIHARIIVPVDALRTGLPLCPGCARQIHPTDTNCTDHAGDADPLYPPDPAPVDREPGGTAAADREPPGRGLAGELVGAHPMFLTPGEARELVLLPGTTLHRLLTDPQDGRLVERTITTYRPDADMRRQVLAADLYSRAPGSRLTGRALEIDHVTPYGTPGGTTTETNLATLDRRAHHAKTLDHLRLELGTRRDLTLTTLLDQRRRTRVHDHDQDLRTAHPDDLDDRRDLANRAIYAHEAHVHRRRRRTRGRTHSPDDDWLTLTHADPDTGGTRYGPHPDTPTLDDVLGIPREQEPGDPPGKEAQGAGGTGDVP